VKFTPLLGTPLTVTTTVPVVAPAGTAAVILLALQQVPQGTATVPLNVTKLAPWVNPKFVPMIVTERPGPPEGNDKLVMLGVGCTVKFAPLLEIPDTFTRTFPDVAF
jgi:hypothetical protein